MRNAPRMLAHAATAIAAAFLLAQLPIATISPATAQEARTCAWCRQPIEGEYVEQNGKPYHETCWEDHVALRCSLCGGIIRGSYVVDAWGNRYHPSHRNDTVPCEYCGRFISARVTHGGVRYADGRSVCNICRKTAVLDPGEARLDLAEAAERLATVGPRVDPSAIRLEMVDLARMGEVSGDRSRRRSGFTQYEWQTSWGKKTGVEKATIYVLAGMPRIETIGTMAHELTHVWLMKQGRHDTRPALAEGSCNYAALLVLGTYPGEESAHLVSKMKQSSDPIYGEGLLRAMRYVDRNGVAAWLSLLASRDDFPPGY